MTEAFDPEIFSNWVGGGAHPRGAITPIGFGTPMTVAAAGGPEYFSGQLATVIPVGSAPYERGTLGGRGLSGQHTFTYFSRTFHLPDDFDVNDIVSVRGAHHLDDVMVLFINGIEVYRINTTTTNAQVYIGRRPSTAYGWNTYVGHNTDARLRRFHINYDYQARDSGYMRMTTPGQNMFDAASRTNLDLALRPGENVITAVVGNNSATSSDLWFDLELFIELSVEYPVRAALNLAIYSAESQNVNVYTAESVQAMQYALDAAIAVSDDEYATQEDVDDATAALNATIRGLVSNGYISYFGARYRFYGRSNYYFLYDAFDPEIFSNWVGGGDHPRGAITPIGFGTPMTAANAGGPKYFSGQLATIIPSGSAPYERGTLGGAGDPGQHTFTYFSRTFNLPDDFDVNDIVSVRGAHHIDDNMVLFINGIEVYRFNTTGQRNNVFIGRRPSTELNWNWYVGQNTDARLRTFHIDGNYSGSDADGVSSCGILFQAASRTRFDEALQPGQNVLTAAVGNNSAASSDLWFNLELYIQMDYPVLSALNLAIYNAQSQNANVYTAESLQAMQDALDYAIEVRGNELATQQDVDDAAETLNAAIRGLVSNGYISYFGARYRFYGRSNPVLMTTAFNPDIFLNWVGGGAIPQGAPTPIGFGTPMSVANAGGTENYSGPLATLIPDGEGSYLRHGMRNGVLGNHTFTYFSRTFNLPDDFDIGNIGEVRGSHHIDDNMVLFVNGIEIYRFNVHEIDANMRIDRAVGWDGFLGLNTDARLRRFHIDYDYNVRDSGYPSLHAGRNLFDAASRTNLKSALRPGENVITAAVGNNSAASSDLWFDLELFIETISEPEITAVSLGDNEVTVSLIPPRTPDAVLIVATYYYDGSAKTMINVAQPADIIPGSDDDITIPIDLTGANRVKVMMWEMDIQKPLSDYYERVL